MRLKQSLRQPVKTVKRTERERVKKTSLAGMKEEKKQRESGVAVGSAVVES